MTENQRKADRYLQQVRNADREVNEMILKIDYLRYKASGAGAIRYDKDRIMTSPEDMMCEAVTEAVALERQLASRHKELLKMREQTELIISTWNDNNGAFIDSYYLDRRSMVDTAKFLGCSDRNCYFIKLKALEEFSKYCGDFKNNT